MCFGRSKSGVKPPHSKALRAKCNRGLVSRAQPALECADLSALFRGHQNHCFLTTSESVTRAFQPVSLSRNPLDIHTARVYKSNMETLKETKVFMNGSSQAVRIPKGFRFRSDVVYLKKVPGGVLMIAKEQRFEAMRDSLSEFTGDFMKERDQGKLEKRADLEPLTATKNH